MKITRNISHLSKKKINYKHCNRYKLNFMNFIKCSITLKTKYKDLNIKKCFKYSLFAVLIKLIQLIDRKTKYSNEYLIIIKQTFNFETICSRFHCVY